MKYIVGVLAFAFAIYTGIQSYMIAQIGIVNQIPQLEGDGGGGVVFTALLVLIGILALFKPFLAVFLFVFSALLSLLVGLTYQDPVTMYWSIGPFLLSLLLLLSRYIQRRKHKAYPA